MKPSRIIRLDDLIARAVRVYRARKLAGKPYAVALKRVGDLTNAWHQALNQARDKRVMP